MVGMGDWTVLGGWDLGLDSPWPEAPGLVWIWDWTIRKQ